MRSPICDISDPHYKPPTCYVPWAPDMWFAFILGHFLCFPGFPRVTTTCSNFWSRSPFSDFHIPLESSFWAIRNGQFPIKLSVVVTTTTLKNFSLAYFGASLPTLHNTLSCFVKYSSFSVFLAQRKPVDHIWSIRFTGCSPRLGLAISWVASTWKLRISRGQPAFPRGIVQSSLIACWALGLRNPASQPS